MNKTYDRIKAWLGRSKTVLAGLAAGLLTGGATVLVLSGSLNAATDWTEPEDMPPSAAVRSPYVPPTVEFAGQTVDLHRRDMFERFDRELTAIAFSHTNMLLNIKRANRYFPEMDTILQRHNVPQDMLYLACVESWLDPRAASYAKAGGVWQIMPATAQELGLEVNDSVDERYNLELATDAACRMLNRTYKKFGNWESVAAAYNGGPGRITRELEAQLAESGSAYDLYLTEETSRYMFRLLAMKQIMEHPAAYGFSLAPSDLYDPVEYTVEEVAVPVPSWPAWAAERGLSYMELRDHNPWIRGKSLPNKSGKTYRVRIPKPESLRRGLEHRVYNPAWTAAATPAQ